MTNHQSFFKNEVPRLLKRLKKDQKPAWGTMNAVQMIDHLLAGTNILVNGVQFEIVTPTELMPKFKAFLMSDKPFKPGAKKPDAYKEYEERNENDIEVLKESFLSALQKLENKTATQSTFVAYHPNFGQLNAEEARQLEHKHIVHHFTQFGLMK